MKKQLLIILTILCIAHVHAQKPVVIHVKDLSDHKSNKLVISKSSKIFEPDVSLDETISTIKIYTDSTYKVSLEGIETPALLRFNILHSNWQTVIVSPGDSLNVLIENPKNGLRKNTITINGTNEKNYLIGRILDQIDEHFEYTSTPKNYSEITAVLKQHYEKKTEFINTYHNKYDKSIIDLFKALNTIMHAAEIAYAIDKFKIECSTADFKNFIDQYQKPIASETSELLMHTNQYAYRLKQIFGFINDFENPQNDFLIKQQIANKYFSQKSRGLLLANNYYRFVNSKQDPESLKNGNEWYTKNKGKLGDDAYHTFIDFAYALTNKINRPWPKEILNVEFYDANNKPVKFSEILDKYKNSPLVIDHWASWCSPCISEFTFGKNVKNDMEARGFKFIYLSIDNDDAVQKMDEIVMKYNLESYRLSKKHTEVYKRYLEITYIPRYVLVNPNGLLVHTTLPRPSSDSVFKQTVGQTLQKFKK